MSPLRGLRHYKALCYNHDVPTALFFNPEMAFRLVWNGFSSGQEWFFCWSGMVFRLVRNGLSSVQKWFFVWSGMGFL